MSKCRRYGNNSAWSWLCLYHAPLIQSFIKWLHLLLMNTHLEWTLKSSQKAQKEKSLSVTNSPVTLWYVHTDTVIVFLSVFYHWTWLRSVCQPSWRIRWNVNRSVFPPWFHSHLSGQNTAGWWAQFSIIPHYCHTTAVAIVRGVLSLSVL